MSESASSTPGSRAIENIKNRDKELVEFKKPTNAVGKKGKPKILTEEKYIEELSKIIQRDFFPDLDRLRAQNDYLDAMDRNDFVQMEAIRAKYSGHRPTERSRSMTPATFETPASAAQVTPRLNSQPVPSDTPKSTVSDTSTTDSGGGGGSLSKKHSLDSFLQAYTSEDNYSFQEIIETAEQKLRQKFAVLYNEERLSADKLARALALPSIEKQFEEPDPMRKIETWTYTNMNSIMYIPDGVQLTEKERIEAVNRKQVIQHNATRLSVNPFSASNKAGDEKIDAQKAASQASIDKIGVDGISGSVAAIVAPQIRGFDLVKTPSPRPGEAFSPLMTWGEIEGTPFRLDASDTPRVHSSAGPSFKITETSRRENIALALAEKVGEKMRAQKQRAMNTARKNINSPFIRSNMERLASMSPAARHLATTKLGLRTTPSMTPSPLRTPKLMAAKGKSTSANNLIKPHHMSSSKKKTAELSKSDRRASSTPKELNDNGSDNASTLTDDLLKIPTKRLKAADFF